MGYFGTIVAARPGTVLTSQDSILGFGSHHTWLRDLGGDWQLVETTGRAGAPGLVEASRRFVAATGVPVYSADVCGGDCALICVAEPAAAPTLAHLPGGDDRCAYDHDAVAVGRPVEPVVADLVAWAQAAGLPVRPSEVAAVLRRDPETAGTYLPAEQLVCELLVALGAQRIGQAWGYAFDIGASPLYEVCGYEMLADQVSRRNLGGPGSWQTEAVALHRDAWSMLYEPDADGAWLSARADWVLAARELADRGRPAPLPIPASTTTLHSRHPSDPHYDDLRSGRPQPSELGSMSRGYANEKATPS